MLTLPSLLVEGNPELSDWNILHAFRGSFAHGTRLDPDDPFFIDDIDTIGICVPPPEYYIGLKKFHSQGTREIKYEEWERSPPSPRSRRGYRRRRPCSRTRSPANSAHRWCKVTCSHHRRRRRLQRRPRRSGQTPRSKPPTGSSGSGPRTEVSQVVGRL